MKKNINRRRFLSSAAALAAYAKLKEANAFGLGNLGFGKLGASAQGGGGSGGGGISIPNQTFNWVAEGDSITLGLGGTPSYPFVSLAALPGASVTITSPNSTGDTPVTGGGHVYLTDIGTSGISTLTMSTNYSTRAGAKFDGTKNVNVLSYMGGTNSSGSSDTSPLQKYRLIRQYLRKALFTGYTRRIIGTITARDDDGGAAWTSTLVPLNSYLRTYYNSDLDCDALADWGNDSRFSPNTAADDLTYYTSDKLHPNVAGEAAMGAVMNAPFQSALAAAGARALPPMTWSIFDTPLNLTFSNSNRTLSNLTGTNTGISVAAFPRITGKRYWEVSVDTYAGQVIIGIINENLELGISSVDIYNRLNALAYVGSSGAIEANSVTLATIEICASGDVIQFAMDNDAKLLWVRRWRAGVTGNWNGSGTANPATGVGGIDISSLYTADYGGGRIHPAATPRNNTAQLTLNLAASQLAGTPPSGFLALDQ